MRSHHPPLGIAQGSGQLLAELQARPEQSHLRIGLTQAESLGGFFHGCSSVGWIHHLQQRCGSDVDASDCGFACADNRRRAGQLVYPLLCAGHNGHVYCRGRRWRDIRYWRDGNCCGRQYPGASPGDYGGRRFAVLHRLQPRHFRLLTQWGCFHRPPDFQENPCHTKSTKRHSTAPI